MGKRINTGETDRIYIVAPSLKAQGGIPSVLNSYKRFYAKRFNLVFIPTYSGKSFLSNLTVFCGALLRVFFVCLTDNEALFHIHTAKKGSFLRKAMIAEICLKMNKKVIIHIHSGNFDQFLENSTPEKKRKIISLLNRVHKVVVLTHYWKGYYSQYVDGDKIAVIYNPVRVIQEDSLCYQEKKDLLVKICFAGKLHENKGIYDLIRAAGQLGDRAYIVDLYGNGETESVKNRLEEEGLTAFFRLHGWIRNEAMQGIYASHDIIILPSYYEGLPMSILEGMSCGLPVISTRVGGIPETVIDGYNGLLVEPGDISGLAEAMRTLIDSADLRRKYGERSRRIAEEKFSAEVVGEQLERLYKEVKGDVGMNC